MNKLIPIVISMLLMGACNHGEMEALKLNNGKKWKVNAEMQPHILQGQEILQAYIAAEDTDYKALAEALKAQNTKLIKSCTMDGTSHDELHKWLYPHIQLIKDLSKASNVEEAELAIAGLEQSFTTYHAYFE